MAIVEFKNVSRVYQSGDHQQKALDNVSMKLNEGKFVVVLGPSGAGKSTLLNLLGGLDSPTDGKFLLRAKISPPFRTMNLPNKERKRSALYSSFTTLSLR